MSESAVRLDSVTRVNPETLTSKVGASYRFRYIDITAVSTGKVNVPSDEVRYADAPSRARRLLRKGDVLLGTVRPNLKAFAHFSESDGEYVASTGFAVLRALPGNDPRYLFSCLLTDDVARQMAALAVGSNYPALTSSDVRSLLIPALGFDAQHRIADILSTVDEAIEKTEALIAKQQQIKAGLMQDLFSRGVLPDGRLRPTRNEAPALYKETPLGWLPKEWEVTSIAACLQLPPSNGLYKPPALIGSGVLLVGQTAFDDERVVDFNLARRAEITLEECVRFGLQYSDILLARVFATIDGVGQPAFVPNTPEPAVYESNMMRLRVNPHIILPRLMFEWLKGDAVRRRISSGASASNQVSINQRALLSIPVPRPSGTEQNVMLAVLESAVATLQNETGHLSKLLSLKQGLMADLLSGRVSFDALEEALGA